MAAKMHISGKWKSGEFPLMKKKTTLIRKQIYAKHYDTPEILKNMDSRKPGHSFKYIRVDLLIEQIILAY